MITSGELRRDADPERLAVSTIASLQGGLILAELERDTRPLEIALDAAIAHLRPSRPTTTTTHRRTTMTVKLGLLALLEAKPGKGDDLGSFLEAGRALAVAEEGTVTWYAFKISDTQLRDLRHIRDRGRPPGAHQR